jgi:hypothetical protein
MVVVLYPEMGLIAANDARKIQGSASRIRYTDIPWILLGYVSRQYSGFWIHTWANIRMGWIRYGPSNKSDLNRERTSQPTPSATQKTVFPDQFRNNFCQKPLEICFPIHALSSPLDLLVDHWNWISQFQTSSLPAMCSCARLLPPLFSPAPSPKPRPAFPHGPTPARSRALVALAGAASRDDAPAPLSGFDFLALKRELEEEEEEEAVVAVDSKEGGAVNVDDGESGAERSAGGTRRRRRRQMARRSALLAKQVISVSSARSLGFVSQLWIDAASVCEGCCSLHFILWVWSSCVLWHRVARGRRLAFAFHNIVQLPYWFIRFRICIIVRGLGPMITA